jgi:hypothetical protein
MATKAELVLVDPSKPALALDIPKGQSFDEWVELGRRLCETDRRIQWWIGDWWAAGSHRYGERAAAAAEGIFGREFQTLRNAASVARSFETSRRRDALSFHHHETVASLPPKEADKLLDAAEAQNMPVRNLRIAAMKVKVSLGMFPERDVAEPDPGYNGFMNVGRSWNRERQASRVLFVESLEEMGAIEIVDRSKLGDVTL